MSVATKWPGTCIPQRPRILVTQVSHVVQTDDPNLIVMYQLHSAGDGSYWVLTRTRDSNSPNASSLVGPDGEQLYLTNEAAIRAADILDARIEVERRVREINAAYRGGNDVVDG